MKPGDPAYDKLKKAVDTFGLVEPLVWNQRTGNLVGGHQRLSVIEARGDAHVEVSVVDLDDRGEKALNLALNRHSGEWDFVSLADLLTELDAGDLDMEITGFSADELEKLMTYVAPTVGQTDEDAVPEAPQEPITKAGDLWILGKHRLLCGDAREIGDVSRLMDGARAKLLLTDPPYGINIVKVVGSTVGGSKPVTIRERGTMSANGPTPFGGKKNKKLTATVGGGKWVDATEYYPIYGDDKPFDPQHLIGLAEKHILFGGNYFASHLADSRCWLVWNKNNTGHFADCELAWTDLDHGVKMYSHTWNGLVREGVRSEELTKRIHPTQKPVGLFGQIIQDFSSGGDAILDLYLGSGSTLIACEKTGRLCYAAEIEPMYVDVAVKRWEDFTGKKAVRA